MSVHVTKHVYVYIPTYCRPSFGIEGWAKRDRQLPLLEVNSSAATMAMPGLWRSFSQKGVRCDWKAVSSNGLKGGPEWRLSAQSLKPFSGCMYLFCIYINGAANWPGHVYIAKQPIKISLNHRKCQQEKVTKEPPWISYNIISHTPSKYKSCNPSTALTQVWSWL